MRILAAEDREYAGHAALPGQRVQVMRDRHQVGLRRQLVRRMAPVRIAEDAELSGLDEFADLLLRIGEVARR